MRDKEWDGAREALVTMVFLPTDAELACTEGAYDTRLVDRDQRLMNAACLVFPPFWLRLLGDRRPELPLMHGFVQVLTNLVWWYRTTSISRPN